MLLRNMLLMVQAEMFLNNLRWPLNSEPAEEVETLHVFHEMDITKYLKLSTFSTSVPVVAVLL